VTLHVVASPSSGTFVTTSPVVADNWAGPYTGLGGTPLGSPTYTVLSSNDGVASYVAIQTAPGNGTNNQKNALSGTIQAGRTYTITFSAFTLSTAIVAGDFYIHLVTSAGDRYKSVTTSMAGLTTTPTTFSVSLACSGTPVGTGSPNSIELDAATSGGAPDTGKYICCTYVEVALQQTDIARWDDSAGTQLANITKDGYLQSRQLLLNGLTSGTLTMIPGATTISHSLTWPSAQGAASTVLTNNGSGALSWTAFSAATIAVTDSLFSILDDGTPSKIAKFQCASIPAGTTITYTLPDSFTIEGVTTPTLAVLEKLQTWTQTQTFIDGRFYLRSTGSATARVSFNLLNISAGQNVDISMPFYDGLYTSGTMVLPNAEGGTGEILYGITAGAPVWSPLDKLRTWAFLQTFKDTAFKVVGSATASKEYLLELDGATASTTLTQDFRTTATRSLIWTLAGTGNLGWSWTGAADATLTLPVATTTLAGLGTVQTFTKAQTFQPDSDTTQVLLKARTAQTAALLGFVTPTGGTTPFASIYWDSSLGVDILKYGPAGAYHAFDNTGGAGLYVFTKNAVAGRQFLAVYDTVVAASLYFALDSNPADATLLFPSAGGTVVTTSATQNLTNKDLATSTVRCNIQTSATASVSHRFRDSADSTKLFWLDASGITTGTTRKLIVPDAPITITGFVASSDLTAQSAAIAATTIYAVPATPAGGGFYRISWMATITTAASTSSALGGGNGFQIRFTDPTDSVVKTSNPTTVTVSAGNTTATTISGVWCGRCKLSTNLQYLFDYTTVGITAMVYDLSIRVEFLS
jgi:hypothetical protein